MARTHELVPKQFLRSSDWLMRSEVRYFSRGLISGLNDGTAATLIEVNMKRLLSLEKRRVNFHSIFTPWVVTSVMTYFGVNIE